MKRERSSFLGAGKGFGLFDIIDPLHLFHAGREEPSHQTTEVVEVRKPNRCGPYEAALKAERVLSACLPFPPSPVGRKAEELHAAVPRSPRPLSSRPSSSQTSLAARSSVDSERNTARNELCEETTDAREPDMKEHSMRMGRRMGSIQALLPDFLFSSPSKPPKRKSGP
jgi:hypothetical protein